MTLIDNHSNKVGTNTPNLWINTSDNPYGASVLPDLQNNLPDTVELSSKFAQEKQKYGLIEKFYDFCKNTTGLGIGSKKVERKIAEFENGETAQAEAEKKISDYKISQEGSTQHFGDLASGLVAIMGYFGLSNGVKKLRAQFETEAVHPLMQIFLKDTSEKFKQTIKNSLKSNKKTKAVIIPLIMLAGGYTKYWLLKFNRLGSKEFKVENKDELDKKELKKAKKALNHKRHNLNFKNFCTGAINGLLAPITTVAGGIAGIPAYILATSGVRFLASKNDNKDKSTGNFAENLKNNIALDSLFAAALAIPVLRKAKYSKILGENLDKVVKKLKDVKLQQPDFPSSKTAYGEIEDILLNSANIKHILSNPSSINEAIRKLTEENIFAVKFLQISKRGGAISSSLIENCPPSRTLSEAQQEINKLLGSDKYKASKLLGVGTVAESYLAKDKSGKEVCIKILKNGIDAAKVQKDKEAFINMVTNGAPKDKLTKAQQYLVKNIENLAESVAKEVDFEHELKAAKKLSKSTKQANVVVPIEAKAGIYVMEKAPGISLDTLVKYYDYEKEIYSAKTKLRQGDKSAQKEIDEFTKKIRDLKAKSPDFKDFDLSTKEIHTLLDKYIDVMVEQFSKVDRNGKTLHADIHPGNIFINLDALKSKKGKLFTLIDTGNTIDLTKEQAISAIKLTSFIKRGNVKDITKYVLESAVLPQGMTQQKAIELVEQDLRKIFFDSKTKINFMSTDELFKLTNNILRKHNIIPNDTQLALNKAKISASNSLTGLVESFFNKKYGRIQDESPKEQLTQVVSAVKDGAFIMQKALFAQKGQEAKNLYKFPGELINKFRNPNMLATNSEEYLTYTFKQNRGYNLAKVADSEKQ
jgi:serine/threonine protein kinase